MDLGDPRESLVSFKTPGTWEADNRVEERWQWGAQLLDLCNLSPEEYKNSTAVTVKTIQDCGECGTGGGGGGDVTSNKGTATVTDNGDFTIVFEEPVASQVYMLVTFTDGLGAEHQFNTVVPKGSDTATFDVSTISSSSPYAIKDIKIGLKEDGSDAGDTAKDKEYEYSTDFEGDVVGKTYVISVLCTKTDGLTGDDYVQIIEAQGEGFDYVGSYDEIVFEGSDIEEQALYYIPCSHSDRYMPEDVEAQFFAEHSYDCILITQKSIIEIKEDFTIDTENWETSTISINGENFTLWLRRDLSGAQCPYSIGDDPCDGYDLAFNIRINK